MKRQSRPPRTIAALSVAAIELDPKRFQYKLNYRKDGATGSLAGVKRWNRYLAGLIQVWKDPVDGKIYCVNGHNRVSLAKQLQVETVLVQFIEAATAQEARKIGALTNIAQGRGTVIDAAKIFAAGVTAAELEAFGISLRDKLAADGLALSRLAPGLLDDVIQGKLPLERGIVIGDRLGDPAMQYELLKLIKAETKRHRRITNDVIRELADIVSQAPSVVEVQQTLFGDNDHHRLLAMEKAKLLAEVRTRLQREKRLFSLVAQQKTAAELATAGNRINVSRSKAVSDEAAIVLGVFDTLKHVSGPVSDAVKRALLELSQDVSDAEAKAIKNTLYQTIKESLGLPPSKPPKTRTPSLSLATRSS